MPALAAKPATAAITITITITMTITLQMLEERLTGEVLGGVARWMQPLTTSFQGASTPRRCRRSQPGAIAIAAWGISGGFQSIRAGMQRVSQDIRAMLRDCRTGASTNVRLVF
jgi:hypothetical protein